MKTFETKKIEVDHTELVEMKCDLCGRAVRSDDWSKKAYGVADTTVEIEEGEHYPEYRCTETTSFDICPDCFKNKLIPWLKSQGAEPTVKENDWG